MSTVGTWELLSHKHVHCGDLGATEPQTCPLWGLGSYCATNMSTVGTWYLLSHKHVHCGDLGPIEP